MTNKIILGTVQFGLDYGINNNSGRPNEKVVSEILDLAFKNGIRLLDTAEAYGNSQELIGEYHKSCDNRFEVITKFSPVRNDLVGSLEAQVMQDLKELNVSSLYCYMFHSFRDFETYFLQYQSDLIELKRRGKIKKFGVSVYSNREIELLLTYEGIDLIQLPFNVLDNFKQRARLILRAKSKGIEIHTRSVFLQGLFFKNVVDFPDKLKNLIPYINEFKDISRKNNLDLNTAALSYAVQQEYIDFVLFGAETLTQLTENLKALQIKLTTQTIVEFNNIYVKETELLNPSNWN